MNEIIFITHIAAVLFFLGLSARFGKSGLIVFVALSAVLANLFVLKQIQLFGLYVTCSDVFAVGGILGLNLIQELDGKDEARKAVYYSFLGLIFFAFMSQIHLLYSPSSFDQTHGAFAAILKSTPRLIGASIGVYWLVQRFDIWFFAQLKKYWEHLGWRMLTSAFVSQGLDTILFSFAGLYGVVSSVGDVIFMSMIVKCAVIVLGSFVAARFKYWARA